MEPWQTIAHKIFKRRCSGMVSRGASIPLMGEFVVRAGFYPGDRVGIQVKEFGVLEVRNLSRTKFDPEEDEKI